MPARPPTSPLVSVVVPAHNAEATLDEAIASLVAQTHRPIELIVVDDGSTDDTAGVARRWRPQVKLIRQRQRGPSAARNTGIRAARGELVAFLDADDRCHPRRLETQVRALAAHPCAGACLTGVLRIDEQGAPLQDNAHTSGPDTLVLDLAGVLQRFNRMGAGLIARRRELLAVGSYDETLATAEDLDILLRLAARKPLLQLRASLYEYRMRPDSLSRRVFTGNRLRVLDRLAASLRTAASTAQGGTSATQRGLARTLRRVRAEVALHYGDDLLWHGRPGQAVPLLVRSLAARPCSRTAGLLLRAVVPAAMPRLVRRLARRPGP